MNFKKIVKFLIVLAFLSLFFYFLKDRKDMFFYANEVSPYFALGFLVIGALILGMVARQLGLPSLTGYLVAGMIFGPQVFGFTSENDIAKLELINSIALSFIAISAGGELRIESLKKNARAITVITVVQTVLIFSVTALLTYFALKNGFFIKTLSDKSILFFSLFLGVIAVAKSPASTIAIINEFKAKGTFTDIVLGITMIKDVVVLLMFSITFAMARNVIKGVPFSAKFILSILSHILISGIAGVILGFLIIAFFRYVAKEISVFIILVSFLAYSFASIVELEYMFMCMVAGFVVQNFSKQGTVLIDAIENSHLPVYVIFFSIAGAGLNFSYLKLFYMAIILFVVIRLFLIFASTYLGAVISKTTDSVKKYGWTGFITNAGLTLSMVILIEGEFTDFGTILKAIVISVIAVNQIIGPVLFKYGITKSGEATKN